MPPYDSRIDYQTTAPEANPTSLEGLGNVLRDLIPPGIHDIVDPVWDWTWKNVITNTAALGTANSLKNDPIHPTLASRQNLVRGKMIRYGSSTLTDTPGGGPQTIKYEKSAGTIEFNFLFQPPRIGMAWQVSDAGANQDVPDGEIAPIGTEAALDFVLFLDRTPEVLEGTMERGVLNDIYVLQRLLGAQGPSANDASTGPLVGEPIDIWIGGKNSFRWWARVESMSIDITAFTRTMVPLRAAVSLSMRRYQDLLAEAGQAYWTGKPEYVTGTGTEGAYTPPGTRQTGGSYS